MANLSDAFGTIRVKNVGREFMTFLKRVQGEKTEAYYTLVDRADLEATPDDDNNLEFTFYTFGRWAYSSNIDGYLKGDWMQNDADKSAYEKLVNAIIKKKGSIEVEYTDSDASMDWMGTGIFRMFVENKMVNFSESFEEQPMNVKNFAEINGETEYWALEYLHGDEVAAKYDEYAEALEKEGKLRLGADEWYATIYEEEV